MCWITDKKPTRKTATEDIICYKVFYSKEIKYKIKRFLGILLYKEGIKELYSLYRNYKYSICILSLFSYKYLPIGNPLKISLSSSDIICK